MNDKLGENLPILFNMIGVMIGVNNDWGKIGFFHSSYSFRIQLVGKMG